MHHCLSGTFYVCLHWVIWIILPGRTSPILLIMFAVIVMHGHIQCRQLSMQLHVILEWKCMNGTRLLPRYGKSICTILIQVNVSQVVSALWPFSRPARMVLPNDNSRFRLCWLMLMFKFCLYWVMLMFKTFNCTELC